MSTTKRFLLSRTDRLGDLVLSTPVATALKRHFPGCETYFLARDNAAEILELHPHVDGVLCLATPGSMKATMSLAKRLRRYRFDAVVALYPRPSLALAFYCAAIPLRIGTGYRWYSALFNRRVYEHRRDASRHEAEFGVRLLRPLGVIDARVEFHHRFDAAHERTHQETRARWKLQRPYVVLHPGSGHSARDWPVGHFAALAAHLSRERQMQVVLTGGAHERRLTAMVAAATDGRAIDMAGALSLTELACVLRDAALFVGNSSGPLHLARMLGTRVLAFYPPITACRPERWGPYGCQEDVLMSRQDECRRCRNEQACACMQEISVAAAIAQAEERLFKPTMHPTPVTLAGELS